jgi:hypothetical protein
LRSSSAQEYVVRGNFGGVIALPEAARRLSRLLVLDDGDEEDELDDIVWLSGGVDPRIMTVGPVIGDVGRDMGPCLLERTAACRAGNQADK